MSDEIHLLRSSFAELARHGDVAGLVFYQRLFSLDPGLRPLFRQDIVRQSCKLMDMLEKLMALLCHPEDLDRELRALGARHVHYGACDAHYATVGRALLEMMEQCLGRDFTPETRQAWKRLFQQMADAMLAGARVENAAILQTGGAAR